MIRYRQCSRRRATWLLACGLALSAAASRVGASVTFPEQSLPKGTADRANAPVPDVINRVWTGDFDGMVKRRVIRILTPYSRTHYFVDKGVQRGLVYESGVLLEREINKLLKTTPATKVHVVFLATSRDALYQSLIEGRGDIVAANVTITPERAKLVDFTTPARANVNQVFVTSAGAHPVETVDDLAGRPVAVREKSLQSDCLETLNGRFKSEGKPLVRIRTVPTALEDEDILEMVDAGLLTATVVDDAIATFWKQILTRLNVRQDIIVCPEGAIAWAVRKNSPKLIGALNPIIATHKQGTLFGNDLLRRYLKSTKPVKNAASEAELRKFRSLVDLFRKYAGKYGLDYVLMMAQGYQESQLDHSAKSQVGAIGVMQVMPSTGKELKVGDIRDVESNIHAGVKYIRFMIDEHFASEPMDALNKTLFAFAAYNAGPGRVRQLRREAAARGLDPNQWFNNVERVAADRVGREPVQYVSNIYKYYVAYSLTLDEWQLGK